MMTVDSIDDGWKPIDDNAPKTGHCWLTDESKRMAWESYQGVDYQPLSDLPPAFWKLGPD